MLNLDALAASNVTQHGKIVDALEDLKGNRSRGEDEQLGGVGLEKEREGLGDQGVRFLSEREREEDPCEYVGTEQEKIEKEEKKKKRKTSIC